MSRWLSDYLRMVGVSLQPKFHLASHRPVLVPLWPSSSFSSNLSNDKAAMMLWWISHYFIDLNKVQKLCIKKVKVYNVWKLLMISIKILINHWSYPANERLTFWHRKTLFHWTLCFYISLILCFLWVLKIIYLFHCLRVCDLIVLQHVGSFPFYCFPLFLCTDHWGRLSYLSLLFFGTLHSNGCIFTFLLCLFKAPELLICPSLNLHRLWRGHQSSWPRIIQG